MKHSTKLLVIVATAISTIGFASAGWAYWTTTGTGSASSKAGTLNAPTITTATWSGSTGNVTVSWTAPSSGPVPSGYYVQRDGTNVCGSPAGPLPATTCIDSDVPGPSHTYKVTAVFNAWIAPASTSVVVTPSVAITSGQSVAAGGTIAATLHGFRSVDTIAFRLDSASGTPITTTAPASVATPAGSGSATATLTIPAGATAGTHTIYAAGSLADSATSTTFTVTSSAPSMTSLVLANHGSTAGKMEASDTVTATFSQALRVSTICSAWTNDAVNQTNSTATVHVTGNGGVANNVLSIPTWTGCPTFKFGSIDLGVKGSSGYVTSSGSSDKPLDFTGSTVAYDATAHTITITLGTLVTGSNNGTPSTVATSVATLTIDPAIQGTNGLAVSPTTKATSNVQQF
jgi:hypothetical protein